MGTGRMAGIMSETLQGMAALGEVELWAIGSRSQEKADAMAERWGFKRGQEWGVRFPMDIAAPSDLQPAST